MIRKLASGEYRIYSRKKNPKRISVATWNFFYACAAKKHEKLSSILNIIEELKNKLAIFSSAPPCLAVKLLYRKGAERRVVTIDMHYSLLTLTLIIPSTCLFQVQFPFSFPYQIFIELFRVTKRLSASLRT
jgi:hypothetical protein